MPLLSAACVQVPASSVLAGAGPGGGGQQVQGRAQAVPTPGLHMEVSQVRAQLGHAPAPGDRRPQAQRQPGLRRRRGPAHERRKGWRAAPRTYESIAEEVTRSDTEQIEAVTKQVVAESVTEQVAESDIEGVAVTVRDAEEAAETVAE